MLIQIGRPRERTGWIYSIVMVNVSHIRTLSSVESTTSSPSIRLTVESIWNYAGNTLVNQHSDINKTHEILQDESKCEMIVIIENFMTSSAKYADILLPDLMTVEQEDIIPNDYAGN
ncbi:molybdopterin-dependent oxidoreductase, partial [Escherichia coli]|nr:molybdopterin-dependent oxidoreductase [Escherichia coli]